MSGDVTYVLADVIIFVYDVPCVFWHWWSKFNNSQNIITGCDGISTNCDSLVYYKVRWTVITNCDSIFITKCDGFIANCDRYYKVRWLLQIATGITKCDDYFNLLQYTVSFVVLSLNISIFLEGNTKSPIMALGKPITANSKTSKTIDLTSENWRNRDGRRKGLGQRN